MASHMRERRIEHLRIGENPLDVLAQHVVAAAAMDDWRVDDLAALVRRGAVPVVARVVVVGRAGDARRAYPSDVFAELRPRLVWDRDRDVISGRPGNPAAGGHQRRDHPRPRALRRVPSRRRRRQAGRAGRGDGLRVARRRRVRARAASWRIEDITHDRVLVSPRRASPDACRSGTATPWVGCGAGPGHGCVRARGQRPVPVRGRGEAARRGARRARRREPDRVPVRAARRHRGAANRSRAAAGALSRRARRLAGGPALPFRRSRARAMGPGRRGGSCANSWAWTSRRSTATTASCCGFRTAGRRGLGRRPRSRSRRSRRVDRIVTAEVGGSALFAARFRECAARSLLLPRRQPGKRAPLWQQRRRSAQLLAIAAEYPGFPVVLEAMRECLQDVYDLSALRELLTGLGNGSIALREVSTEQPSPFARSLLFGYVEAFMYEGDSPLAERRAQALALDSSLLAELLGTVELRELLDAEAMAAVAAEVGWRTAERPLRDVKTLLTHSGCWDRWPTPTSYCAGGPRMGTGAGGGQARHRGPDRRRATLRGRGRRRPAARRPGDSPARRRAHRLHGTSVRSLGDLLARYARTHGPFTADGRRPTWGSDGPSRRTRWSG